MKKIMLFVLSSCAVVSLHADIRLGRGGGFWIGDGGQLTSNTALDLDNGYLRTDGSNAINASAIGGTNLEVDLYQGVHYSSGTELIITHAHPDGINTDATNGGTLRINGSGAIGNIYLEAESDLESAEEPLTKTLYLNVSGSVGNIQADGNNGGALTATVELEQDLHFTDGGTFINWSKNDTFIVNGNKHTVFFGGYTDQSDGAVVYSDITCNDCNLAFTGNIQLKAPIAFTSTDNDGLGDATRFLSVTGNNSHITLGSHTFSDETTQSAGLLPAADVTLVLRDMTIEAGVFIQDFFTDSRMYVFHNVTIDGIHLDNITMTAFSAQPNGTNATNFAECECTFAPGPDSNRRSKITLQKDIIKKEAWTVFDQLDVHLNGYTLDLKTDANSAIIFPESEATVSIRNGRVVLIDTSFSLSTTPLNSVLELYDVTLRPASHLGDATNGFFAPGVIKILEDSVLAYGEWNVTFQGSNSSGTVIINDATFWQDNLTVNGGGGTVTPSEIDGSVVLTTTGAARYAFIGAATSVSLASISDLTSLSSASSTTSIESFSTTGTTLFSDASPVLVNDISLRGENADVEGSGRLLNFTHTAGAVTLDGGYQTLHFPQGVENVATLADNVSLITTKIRLNNVYLGNGASSHFGIGAGASVTFGTETLITIGHDHAVTSSWNVEEYVTIDLQGHTLVAPVFTMVGVGASIYITNGRLINPTFTAATTVPGTITLKDVEISVPKNETVVFGANSAGASDSLSFILDGEVVITGGGTVSINCDIANNKRVFVQELATVVIDGTSLTLTSPDDTTNKEVFKISEKGTLKLIGCTINVGSLTAADIASETFSITTGTVVMDHINLVAFKRAEAQDITVNLTLGGTTLGTELDLIVMPGALLKTSGSGVLNVNQPVL